MRLPLNYRTWAIAVAIGLIGIPSTRLAAGSVPTDQVRNELESIKIALSEAQAAMQNIEDDIEKVASDAAALAEALGQTKDPSTIVDDLNKAFAAVGRIEQQLEDVRDVLASIRAKLQSLVATVTATQGRKMRAEVKRLFSELEKLEEQASGAAAKLDSVRTTLEKIADQVRPEELMTSARGRKWRVDTFEVNGSPLVSN